MPRARSNYSSPASLLSNHLPYHTLNINPDSLHSEPSPTYKLSSLTPLSTNPSLLLGSLSSGTIPSQNTESKTMERQNSSSDDEMDQTYKALANTCSDPKMPKGTPSKSQRGDDEPYIPSGNTEEASAEVPNDAISTPKKRKSAAGRKLMRWDRKQHCSIVASQ